jgi:hypothetical protein
MQRPTCNGQYTPCNRKSTPRNVRQTTCSTTSAVGCGGESAAAAQRRRLLPTGPSRRRTAAAPLPRRGRAPLPNGPFVCATLPYCRHACRLSLACAVRWQALALANIGIRMVHCHSDPTVAAEPRRLLTLGGVCAPADQAASKQTNTQANEQIRKQTNKQTSR